MILTERGWQWMWYSAAAFNFAVAATIVFATGWSFELAYGRHATDPLALAFWRDFGIFVALIGVGYWLVARSPAAHTGIVYLGIAAKLFDVITLGYRYWSGVAETIVLVPAAIDGGYMVLFVLFLYRRR